MALGFGVGVPDPTFRTCICARSKSLFRIGFVLSNLPPVQMKPRLKHILFPLALLASSGAEEVLYFSMDDRASPLVDAIGALAANAADTGHLYQVAGPPGFGKAVGLASDGSWQLSQDDSAVLRNLANDFSVAVWVYLDSDVLAGKVGANSLLNRVVGDDVLWDADGWAMGVWNDGRVRFTKNGIVDIDLGEPGTVPADEWAHIAATVSSTEGSTLFVNGVPVGSNQNTAPCNIGPGRNGELDVWAVGRAYGVGGGQWFAGRMDELRVFNHVLTEGEVADLMVVPRDPALVTNLLFSGTGVNQTQSFTLTVDNDGENNDLTITEVTFSGGDAADFAGGPLPGPIAPGGQDFLGINFTPSAGPRTYNTTAIIASNDPQKPSFEVAIEVVVIDPAIRVEGDLAFGEVSGDSVSRMVTVFNDGVTQNLEVTGAVVTGSRAGFYSVIPSNATILPGESNVFTITLDPVGEAGGFNGNLEITSNDLSRPIITLPVTAQTPFGPLASHLVSHFTFDESAAVGNDTGLFNLDGTVMGDAAYTSDSRIGGGALRLDGDGDSLVLGGGSEFSGLDDNGVGFTLAVWVNLDEAALGNMRIFSTSMPGGFTAQGWGVGFGTVESGNLLATTYGRLDYRSPAGTFYTRGQWHHVAYVYRQSPISEVEFFIDGVSVGTTVSSAATTGLNNTGDDFAIGGLGLPGDPQSFSGKLDDLRIYNIELSEDVIASLANNEVLEGGLEVISTEVLEGAFRLTWNSLPGRSYVVSRSFDDPNIGLVALENWEEIAGGIEATEDTTSFADTNPPVGANRVFYRVSEAP